VCPPALLWKKGEKKRRVKGRSKRSKKRTSSNRPLSTSKPDGRRNKGSAGRQPPPKKNLQNLKRWGGNEMRRKI